MLGAVGVVGFAGVGYFGIGAIEESNRLHGLAPTQYTQSDVNSVDTKRTLADVALGVGVLGVGAAAWILVASLRHKTSATTAFGIRLVQGGSIATWEGAY